MNIKHYCISESEKGFYVSNLPGMKIPRDEGVHYIEKQRRIQKLRRRDVLEDHLVSFYYLVM